ncbi:nuclear transport factor 2 family protein [Pengzhenrongella phosphoraccumulans]|uniref:nuclear transport factor 2 family protein n=1 Tax=Pengzhenrongella phosphoraccumulans TaxID=3114394 RepID=UPI003890E955
MTDIGDVNTPHAQPPARSTQSPLDRPPAEHVGKAFFAETLTLLRCVRDHDFDALADLCDDDFGIVDVAPDGAAVPIRTRPEWEDWFHTLFSTLDTMGAATDSQVLAYDARAGADLGYGVLEFRQTLTVGPFTATFDCIATLIWKRSGARWVESRWHCSVISKDVPPELLATQN